MRNIMVNWNLIFNVSRTSNFVLSELHRASNFVHSEVHRASNFVHSELHRASNFVHPQVNRASTFLHREVHRTSEIKHFGIRCTSKFDHSEQRSASINVRLKNLVNPTLYCLELCAQPTFHSRFWTLIAFRSVENFQLTLQFQTRETLYTLCT